MFHSVSNGLVNSSKCIDSFKLSQKPKTLQLCFRKLTITDSSIKGKWQNRNINSIVGNLDPVQLFLSLQSILNAKVISYTKANNLTESDMSGLILKWCAKFVLNVSKVPLHCCLNSWAICRFLSHHFNTKHNQSLH